MYFFRVEISSFDDEKKVLYLIPDQSDTDEHGIPFQEKLLTSSPQYKEFVKETKTSVVDVEYTVYRTSAPIAGAITDESFEQMSQDNALELLDGNEFSITTGKSAKSSGKGGNKSTYIVFGMIATVIVLMIIISAVTGNKGEGKAGTGTTEATAEITAEIKTNEPETHEAVTTEPVSATKEPEQQTSEPAFVDTPPQETAESITADTKTAEPENVVSSSSGGSTSSSTQSEYTISFHANGGTGTLESITSAPGQYVVLPSADAAAQNLSKEGYKLIGFSDNVEINYPLYDYLMPSSNITLYAVWEPQTYTVTYNSNGGTGSLSRAEVKYGEAVPMPTEVSIYNGKKVLSGWSTSEKAKNALSKLTMPAENLTLYAVWGDKKPTVKLTLHYDDEVLVMDKEIGTTLNMLDDFGVSKDGFIISGWYFDNSPQRIEYLSLDSDCDVYGKWERAEYITVTVDQSYLNKPNAKYKIALDMNGSAKFTTPAVNNPDDIYNHVPGCTYGFARKPQKGQYGTIEFYSNTEYKFTDNITLYRVLNKYGGGKGTEKDPYIIDRYDQLIYLSEHEATGYFKQTANITFPVSAERKSISTPTISLGYENKYYDHFVYNGQNYTIKGLKGEGGLFGRIAASTIMNVRITGARITSGGKNCGVLVNEVTSYLFDDENSSKKFTTGNSTILNCSVSGSTLSADETTEYMGGLVGYGGVIKNCLASSITFKSSKPVTAAGGIVGNACTVKGCLVNSVSADKNVTYAGGIAGIARGVELAESRGKTEKIGGSIIGCGVRTFISSAENNGGIAGMTTSINTMAYIKSCYVANIVLNGKHNGSISGIDGTENYRHSIAYCIVDNTNGYEFIGENARSSTSTMVLNVPADSGLTVDGVLSVLNASGSGYTEWQRSKDKNSGYPFPGGITF